MEPKKVLIVDDEETIAWGIAKTLSQSELNIQASYTVRAKEALEKISQEPFDLVITDIRMPDMSGIDLLKEIKDKFPETGVIIMTAYGSTEVQQEASKRGSIFYIEKPFDIKVLKKVISEFFSKKDEQKPVSESAPVNPESEEAQFGGSFSSLQLMDVVQMNCLGRITCTLKVEANDKEGIIVFKKGDIVHAETHGMEGKEAFFNITAWQGGNFDMIDEIPSKVTIIDHWEQLLLEVLQMQDDGANDQVESDDFDFDFGQPESGSFLEQSEQIEEPSEPVSPVMTSELTESIESANDTSTLMERIQKQTNAVALFIMTPDGFVIDRRIAEESLDIDQSGENISKTLSAVFALGSNMKAGELNWNIMSFHDKHIIVKSIPNSELLFVVAAPITQAIETIIPVIDTEAKNLTDII